MPATIQVRRFREERFALLAGVVLSGLGLIVLGLLRLQVVEHEHFRDLAKNNRVRMEVLRAPRGAIFDRHGELLADNRPSFEILFRPFPAESAGRYRIDDDWYARAAALVEVDSLVLRAAVKQAGRSGESVVLRENAPFEVMAAVEELGETVPGIEVRIEPLRHYLHGAFAGHVLGYAGEINEAELATRLERGYRPGDLIGRSGLERAYETDLRGIDGAEFVVVNAMGQRVSTLTEGPPRLPTPGRDLVLTLDLGIQRSLEQAMAHVKRGAAVAIDPRDGGILAMVSRPAIDPNEFSVGISSARWREMTEGGANPLLNRAIQGTYPPGSTYKIVSMVAAMNAGIAGPATRVAPCMGSYRFGGRSFGCWKREGHGSLDFIGALQHSCDVYFYQMGPRIGLERLGEASRAMGMGRATGIDLPQERDGLIPDREWYDRRRGGHFRESFMLNLIIGQGELLLTPLQMATMVAETAREGAPIQPHLLMKIPGGEAPVRRVPPHPGLRADAGTWDAVHEALVRVVQEGTGTAARVPGVRVAGKTGTAQNPHGDDHALFVCYAPAENPTIAMAIVIENSGHGGSVAAPIAGEVLRAMFLPDSLRAGWAPPPRDTTGVVRGD
jgi:penicillin-binding protein 2